MRETVHYEWEGKRIEHGERTSDWYWALAIIAVASIVVSLLFNNILLALVILTGVSALILETRRAPRIHRFAISDAGVYIDDTLYPYERILSFSILEYIYPSIPPPLSIKKKYLLYSHLVIPVLEHDPEEVYEYLEQHLEEGHHHTHALDRLLEHVKL